MKDLLCRRKIYAEISNGINMLNKQRSIHHISMRMYHISNVNVKIKLFINLIKREIR